MRLDVGFWRAGWATTLTDDNAVDALGHGSKVWMQDLDPAKPLRYAVHVDVLVAREHAVRRLEAALAAGDRVVEDTEAPACATHVLAAGLGVFGPGVGDLS